MNRLFYTYVTSDRRTQRNDGQKISDDVMIVKDIMLFCNILTNK